MQKKLFSVLLFILLIAAAPYFLAATKSSISIGGILFQFGSVTPGSCSQDGSFFFKTGTGWYQCVNGAYSQFGGSGVATTNGSLTVDMTGAASGDYIKLTGATTASVAVPGRTVSAQTGASYTYVAANRAAEVDRSNSGSAMTDTLPDANTTGFESGYPVRVCNIDSTASLTINRQTSSTINGATSLVVSANTCVDLTSGTTNWTALTAGSGGTSVSGGGGFFFPENLGGQVSSSNAISGTANDLDVYVFTVSRTQSFTKLTLDITALSASASPQTCDAAIYNSSGTRLASLGGVECGTGSGSTGAKTATVSLSLSPGTYVIGACATQIDAKAQGFAPVSATINALNTQTQKMIGRIAGGCTAGVTPSSIAVSSIAATSPAIVQLYLQ